LPLGTLYACCSPPLFRPNNQEFDMNRFKIPLVAIIALLLSGTSSYAFHEGSEGYCEGCHTIVSSQNNQDPSANESSDTVPPRLMLKGFGPSSTCLICHAKSGEAYSVLTNDGSAFTPGGDFYWLSKTFSWTNEGRSHQSRADSHGHNIAALDYGLNLDGRVSRAQGGTYPAASMGCTSCHDPHAKTAGKAESPGTTPISSAYGEEPSTGTPPRYLSAPWRGGI